MGADSVNLESVHDQTMGKLSAQIERSGYRREAANALILAFYIPMIALPLIGWGMLSAADYPVVVFGMHLPSILPHSNGLHTLLWNAHTTLALCFFALVVLHLAAALLHALVRRDGVFQAMAPWR